MLKNLPHKIEPYNLTFIWAVALLGLGLLIYSWSKEIDDRSGQWAVVLSANKFAVEIDKDVFFVDSRGHLYH